MHRNNRPDEIRQQMAEVRSDLKDDVAIVVKQAREITDWRNVVRTYPWAAFGVSLVVGYLVIPQRLRVDRPDYGTLEKLAKDNKLIVQPEAKKSARGGGAAGSLFSFLASLAVRSALPVATSYVSQFFHHDGPGPQDLDSLRQRQPR